MPFILAASTICFPKWTLEQILPEMEKAGIRNLELVAVSPDTHIDIRKANAGELHKRLSDHGLSLAALYPPPLSMKDTTSREESFANCLRAVDLAEELDCQRIVFSPLYFWEKKDYPFPMLAEDLSRIAEYIGKRDITVCLENHYGWPLSEPEDYDTLFNLVESDKIAICADTGHFIPTGTDVTAFIHMQASRIRHFHLKDQEGTEGRRFGEGQVNFREILAAPESIDYSGYLTIELETGQSGKGPVTDFHDAVTWMHASLRSMIEPA